MKSKTPKKSPEELALLSAQTRELARQEDLINEKKARILRAQTGSRSSLLSGGERGVRPNEMRSTPGQAGNPGTGGSVSRGVGFSRPSLLGGSGKAGVGRRLAPQAQK